MTQEVQLKGEYWIQDGHVEFADGDVGDLNHEGIATNSVFSHYESEIISLAKDYKIKVDQSYGEYHPEDLTGAIDEIEEILRSKKMSQQQAHVRIVKELGCNNEAFEILCGGGDARLYAMKFMNWIAIRGNNIELFGYDDTKRKHLASGIPNILDDEGIHEEVESQHIEFTLHDLKTNRSSYITLQDIENPAMGMRTNQSLQSTKTVTPTTNAASDENKGMIANKSVRNKWSAEAQKAGIIAPGQDLWRGTSESMSFSKWLNIQESII
jgi:hypothetical protein